MTGSQPEVCQTPLPPSHSPSPPLRTLPAGKYSETNPDYVPLATERSLYPSYEQDHAMLATAWLYRATLNTSYLEEAHASWQAVGRWNASPYLSWAGTHPAAVALLLE